MQAHTDSKDDARLRWRAGAISLIVAIVLLVAKFYAWQLTGSRAVLSDALESIVNVVAAAFALGGLVFAGLPADRNHPYGHGKIEFFAAAFEGGLIAFAAIVILWESVYALALGATIAALGTGIAITLAAGGVNALLGAYLIRTGRRYHSITLEADGQHVLSDFWTSVGAAVGLVLVELTGATWIDPVVAIVMALWLLLTGAKLVRRAAGGLLDEEDPDLLGRLVEALGRRAGHGVITVHGLRAIRAGRFHHVHAHLVVPEFWTVEQAHDVADEVAADTMQQLGLQGEVTFHADPCWRAYCASCDLEICAVRRAPFQGRVALSVDEAVRPDVPRPVDAAAPGGRGVAR